MTAQPKLLAPAEWVAPASYVPFPVDVLPQPFRRFVERSADAIGCQPVFVAQTLLSAAAGAIGNSTCVQLKNGWAEPAVIWTAIIAKSGQLKSPAQNAALRLIRAAQSSALVDFEAGCERFRMDRLVYEKAMLEWKEDKKPGEPPAEPQCPVAVRYLVSETTIEALAVLLRDDPRGLLLARVARQSHLNLDRRFGPGIAG